MIVNERVTIFAYSKEEGDYVKKKTVPAWVRRMKRIRNSQKGVYFCDNFDVRIEYGLIDAVNVGDLIFFGVPDNDELPIDKCRKIAVVAENTYGLNPHWHLEAEYEYR